MLQIYTPCDIIGIKKASLLHQRETLLHDKKDLIPCNALLTLLALWYWPLLIMDRVCFG